jgi:hypothetical protein
LGDRLGLALVCTNAGIPALPDAAPTAAVYDSAGRHVVTYSIPPVRTEDAMFARAIHLGRLYVIGRYAARLSYAVAGLQRVGLVVFDVVAGGDPAGAVIAGYPFHRPQGEFHVLDLDSGELVRGRNPFV